jgi:hypothetical protein
MKAAAADEEDDEEREWIAVFRYPVSNALAMHMGTFTVSHLIT